MIGIADLPFDDTDDIGDRSADDEVVRPVADCFGRRRETGLASSVGTGWPDTGSEQLDAIELPHLADGLRLFGGADHGTEPSLEQLLGIPEDLVPREPLVELVVDDFFGLAGEDRDRAGNDVMPMTDVAEPLQSVELAFVRRNCRY